MVTIRFARGGSKHRPFFNVVVADSRNRRDGRFIERIGFYDPVNPDGPEGMRIQLDRVEYWQGKGAQVSDAVAKLVKRAGAAAQG
jgi:small subunit ribosomal protein S16